MTVNGKYNPNLNLYRYINEPVEKKKLYKSGKSWLIASTTLFVIATMGTIGVNADTNTTTPVTANVPTQVVSTTNNGSSNDPTETTNATPIKNDVASKTPVKSSNTDTQSNEQNDNITKSIDSSDSTKQQDNKSTDKQNVPDQANNNVANSQSEKDIKNSSNNTTNSSLTSNTGQSNQQVTSSNLNNNHSTNDIPSSTNKLGNQVTNLSVTNQSNPDSDLQKTIDDARSKGVLINVDTKSVTILSDGLSDEEKQLQAHYADEIDYILSTVQNYEAALQKAEDDYQKALEEYQKKVDSLKNSPNDIDPNLLTNQLQINSGDQLSTQINITNQHFAVWTGKVINDHNPNTTGWETQPPVGSGINNVPLDWREDLNGKWVQVIYFLGDGNAGNYDNIGTISVSGANTNNNFYKDPKTGQQIGISKWTGKINSLGITTNQGQLWVTGSFGIYNGFNENDFSITNTLYDSNGNPINFSDGGAFVSSGDITVRGKQDIPMNTGSTPEDGTWHWYGGQRVWDNWDKSGGSIYDQSSTQYGDGITGHSFVGSPVQDQGNNTYYSNDGNLTIYGTYDGNGRDNSVVSSNPNNPSYNQTVNHTSGGSDNEAMVSSIGELNGTDFTIHQHMNWNNNGWKNLSYGINSSIPHAGYLQPPVKEQVPAPKINVDTTDIKSVTPTPDKSVNDSTGQDINGKNIIDGSSLDYNINWDLTGLNDLKPSTSDVAKGLSITDNYDNKTTAEQSTLKVYDANGNDITDQVNVSWDANNHVVNVVAKDATSFFNSFKNQKLKIKFIADVNSDASGDVTNTATQNTFGNQNKTNSVIDHIIVPAPTKTVKNQNGQEIDGKNVSRGDTLDYNINWDLTGLNDFNPTSGEIAKGLSITDNFSHNLSPDKSLLRLIDANGNDITDQINVAWDDATNSFTVSAKNVQEFWNKYRGSKLTIDFPATVMGNSGEDIKNQATQNTFGNENKTNIVVSHEPQINPKKDIVIDAGSNDSMNNQNIEVGQTADYKLGASRPANYGGNTNEWSFTDTVPSQDHVTGQWQVYAESDITLSDGTVIHKGTDISKYFTFTIDRNTGKVVISADKDFLDIINSDINKKNEIDWDAYFQIKRVGYGENITNVAEESYNHQIVKTNKIVTNTVKPETPVKSETPASKETKNIPTVAQTVKEVMAEHNSEAAKPSVKEIVRNVVQQSSQPEPKKGTLPQTGEEKNDAENIGFAFLGLAGIMSLFGLARKKKNFSDK